MTKAVNNALIPCQLPRLIAHRGASAYAPENTLSAFSLAHQLGASWVEFDVKLAKCQTPVVFHDESLERVTNGTGFIGDYTFEELRELTVKHEHGQETCCIPSLSQVIAQLTQYGMSANIEIKPNPGQDRLTAEIVMAQLQQQWPADHPAPLISSFESTSLITAYECAPTLPFACLMHEWDDTVIALAHDIHARTVNVNYHLLDADRVQYIHSQGFKVLAYTVNDRSVANTLFDQGVDGVFSDYPDLLCPPKLKG